MDALGNCITTAGDLPSLTLAIAVLAYIDPGSGSLVFQMIVAGLLTAGLMIRGLRERATALVCLPFAWLRPRPSQHSEQPDADRHLATSSRPSHPSSSILRAKKAA